MPLKHTKETFLLLLLGVLFGVTGISAHLLPPLPEGAILWGGLWILTLLYPLLLYPYLRYHRADYLFRILHFLPATLVMLWLLFALIAFAIPSWEVAFRWYVWGFSAAPVLFGLLCICAFSLHVLRQRIIRVMAISMLFFVFAANAIGWEVSSFEKLAVSHEQESLVHLEYSDDPDEESWRKRLRRMERRQSRLKEHDSMREVPVQSVSSSASFSSRPPVLSSSGPSLGMVMLLLFASYPTLLHERARRRM